MSLIDATSSTADGDLSGCSRIPSPALTGSGGFTWVQQSLGRWEWTLRSDWERAIHNGTGPDWMHLDGLESARLVKANDGREVWRVQLGNELVFAKLYFPPRGWTRLRRFFVGPDSARERRVAEYARYHGIRTVQPVASADAPTNGAGPVSILITQGLAHALPLNELWTVLEEGRSPASNCRREQKNASGYLSVLVDALRPTRNTIIDRVARLIAHAHQNGFEHTDLHAGNILIDVIPGGDYQALFVDLHNIRFGRPVSDRAVIRNLAQFNQWFRLRSPLTDRIRFLKRYLHWRSVYERSGTFGRRMGSGLGDLLTAIEKTAHSHANALYAKRDRRATRPGRYFTRLNLGEGRRGYAFLKSKHDVPGSPASRLTFTPEQWQGWLSDLPRWTSTEQSRYSIKKSASGTVCRSRLPIEGESLDVICKRSMPRHAGKQIKNFFRQSRALRTWRLANALLNRQIPTARPLAVVEQRWFGKLVDSLIITEHIEHAHDLDTLLTVQMRDLDPARQRLVKRQVSTALAAVFRALHSRGFVHRDMKAANIMVQWDPENSDAPRVFLVDLDGIRRKGHVRRRDWLRAMMRLNTSLDHCRRVSRTDRLRFLMSALLRPGHPQPDWKPVWREVDRLSAKKRRRENLQFERMMAKYGRI